MGNVFPIQWKAIHLCRPCPYYNTYFPLIKLLFPRHMERNVMIHLGTDEEILETMGQHSLPRDRLPSVFGGGEVLDYPGWAFTRKVMEDETAAPSLGSSPQMSSSSALCGEPEKLNPRLSGPASSTGTASRSPQSSGGTSWCYLNAVVFVSWYKTHLLILTHTPSQGTSLRRLWDQITIQKLLQIQMIWARPLLVEKPNVQAEREMCECIVRLLRNWSSLICR